MERGRSARESVPFKLPVYFFRGGEIISLSKKDTQKTHPKRVIKNTERNPLFKKGKFLSIFLYTDNKVIRERPLLPGVPSFKTVHWTVLKFTPCRAPKVNVDLRSTLGRCPKPCQRRCLWTLPKGHCPFGNPVLSAAPTWDSVPNPAKGTSSLWKPDITV